MRRFDVIGGLTARRAEFAFAGLQGPSMALGGLLRLCRGRMAGRGSAGRRLTARVVAACRTTFAARPPLALCVAFAALAGLKDGSRLGRAFAAFFAETRTASFAADHRSLAAGVAARAVGATGAGRAAIRVASIRRLAG